MTQKEIVLRHLTDHGSITAIEAVQEYMILRLSAVIFQLKKDKVPIQTELIHKKNSYHESIHYAKYSLGDFQC